MKIIKYFNVNEYTSWLISRTTPHNAVIIAEMSNSINKFRLREAILSACSLENSLKLTISPEYCGFLPHNETVKISFIKSNESWENISEKELNTPFIPMESLARIQVIETIESNYISLCVHHIICDGVSIVNFLLKIISVYNSDIASKKTFANKNKVHLKYPIPIPLEKIYPRPKNKVLNITKVQELLIDPIITRNILNYIKINKISLNSFISSAILLSFQQSFNITTGLNLHIPVNLRKKSINNDNKNLGFYTSWISMRLDQLFSEFGCLSILIHSKFKKSLLARVYRENLENLNILINTRVSDVNFITMLQSNLPTVCVSNCGTILTEKNISNLLNIVKWHLSVSCQAHLGEKSITSIVTNLNNELVINICYPYPLISDDKIGYYVKNLKKNILKFSHAERKMRVKYHT